MTSDADCEELGFLQNENVDGTKCNWWESFSFI